MRSAAHIRWPGLGRLASDEVTHPNLKEFVPFIDDLKKESERGVVLRSVSYLENQPRGKRLVIPPLRAQAASDTAFSSLQLQGSNWSMRLLGCSGIRWKTSVKNTLGQSKESVTS